MRCDEQQWRMMSGGLESPPFRLRWAALQQLRAREPPVQQSRKRRRNCLLQQQKRQQKPAGLQQQALQVPR